MLVLTRKENEKIMIGDNIEIMIVEIRNNGIRLGITAPKEIPIYRPDAKRIQCARERTTDEIPGVHFNGDEPLAW